MSRVRFMVWLGPGGKWCPVYGDGARERAAGLTVRWAALEPD